MKQQRHHHGHYKNMTRRRDRICPTSADDLTDDRKPSANSDVIYGSIVVQLLYLEVLEGLDPTDNLSGHKSHYLAKPNRMGFIICL